MSLTVTYNSHMIPNSITSIIPSGKSNNLYAPIDSNERGELTSQASKNSDLNINTIRKIILRFLTEKKMPRVELAKILGVTTKDLERILSEENLSTLISKINLPLVKLYCETKWL